MLDWLGEVTSTVSFCQLSGGVCYPTNLCIIAGLVWTYVGHTRCVIMHFVLLFCPCLMSSLFHV